MSTNHCTAQLADMLEEDWNVAVDCLAASLFTESADLGYAEAFARAEALLPELAAFEQDWDAAAEAELGALEQFAADWDAAAVEALAAELTPSPSVSEVFAGDLVDLEEDAAPAPAPVGEPVYLPALLDSREQRAMDKAMFERAGGVRPRVVGRHAFVPSRTTGGTVYRASLDGSSCSCEAGQRGRPCWHSRLVLLEREFAA